MKKFENTKEIKIPDKLVDQVIGQEAAVKIIKKAARQKRNVLLIGSPGTGKSMLAQAMAELMPSEELEDILVYKNQANDNNPVIRAVKTYPDYEYLKKNQMYMQYYTKQELIAIKNLSMGNEKKKIPDILKIGLGRRIITKQESQEENTKAPPNSIIILLVGVILLGVIFFAEVEENLKWLIIAVLFGVSILYLLSGATAGLARKLSPFESNKPKLIVDNSGKKNAPFVDATGTKAGALLGDCKHDPLQSGGMGTPAHLRIESGAIQKANKGVLFIDEIASLKMNWQQEILTAMQEKKYTITGQSENSSGALVKTEPVPCDFVLVASGNLPDLKMIHPALRSRIRGAGYEVYMEDEMDDNEQNEEKLVQFVAQEIRKDKKIPEFNYDAVVAVIDEARRASGRKKKFTMNLRELGGLVRAAGDVAREENALIVDESHVEKAKKISVTIETQLGKKIIERKKDYQIIMTSGSEIGRVNGLAVLGDVNAGLVLPIVAEITPSSSKSEGRVIATGKLGTIAKEAVMNVSAIIKKYMERDISQKDIHIQFLQTYEGLEGDSASISIAVAVISALEGIPVRQDFAMTGSLDVRGEVLPVGGVSGKLTAAVDSGIENAIVPESNFKDIFLSGDKKEKIKINKVKNFVQVLEYALADCAKKRILMKKIEKVYKNNH